MMRNSRAAGSRRSLLVRANYDNFNTDLLGPHFHNRARISEDVMQSLMELPGTTGIAELRQRAEDLTTWKISLQRGVLPEPEQVNWPVEPFKTKFIDALRALEMPRFTRRYPVVLETLMKQMLAMVHDFELKLLEAEAKQKQQQRPPPQQQAQPSQQGQQQDEPGDQDQEQQGEEGQEGGAEQSQELTQEMLEEALKDSMNQQGQQGQQGGKQIQIGLEEMEGKQAGKGDEQTNEEADEALAQEIEKAAEQIVSAFEQGMQEVMENLEKAQLAFDDLSELLEGEEGFALSQGTWQRDGWRELDDLRKKLENLKELRELVRSLGRSGGKGPLRKAPEELESTRHPPGVVRSPLQPEEVRGLARSGDLSRMLPSEMALLAHGWPRKVKVPAAGQDAAAAAAAVGQAGGGVATASTEDAQLIEEEYFLPGAHAARMLHRVRRAERMLLSYERCGWLDDTPSRLTGRQEIRPAAEMGPIILCLDTSGSMRGARELVAKALALECMRGAHRQQRPCYLYAFSGPDQVQELELSVDLPSLEKLLEFLSCSFQGGTDVDKPLQLSLERLQKDEWAKADILMVTDGEIAPPNEKLLADIAAAHDELGLEVHGLLVSSQVSDSMEKLCTHLHVFKSWSAVGAESWMY
ncbi:hypothetical protein OEZ85_005847 [Tetradesmus obliquus]|uniref:VWFA domain-containing protein n=1 Tax=Tetradesmus obliquus TaxID=3088 RepID=A0ABY8UFZ3_TETOB|nr:hypothetical protein OEZ85_005847 [Tetradesmus obliquus]